MQSGNFFRKAGVTALLLLATMLITAIGCGVCALFIAIFGKWYFVIFPALLVLICWQIASEICAIPSTLSVNSNNNSQAEGVIMTENQAIENNLSHHAPKGDQAERYEKIRAKAKEFAYLIEDLSPKSREQSLAMINLEQSVMWANAAIARNE